MIARARSYLMENLDEAIRLEIKTDPEVVRKQALWAELKPGYHVVDAGCGPGKVSSVLHDIVQPRGSVLGLDYSEDRIAYARKQYGNKSGLDFHVHDLRDPLMGMGPFDLIWVRFVLEYNRGESAQIVRNLTDVLKPGGTLCLMDLDHNCLNHYELPAEVENMLFTLMRKLEQEYDFDPYSGRKLYAYLYDLGYKNITLKLAAHHLIYGDARDEDIFNWIKKVEVVSKKTSELFESYPGGYDNFFSQFKQFFLNPRRFTYTPLILCKGTKPAAS